PRKRWRNTLGIECLALIPPLEYRSGKCQFLTLLIPFQEMRGSQITTSGSLASPGITALLLTPLVLFTR
ncbi:MAG: hypothetical protein KAR43_05505, partial [Deltaproteobacteria bacterium]|nr:hypothetical protein [Deltaproteobacteria bacterium]